MRVAIIGAGVVGAAIAYELSGVSGLKLHVFDQRAAQDWRARGTATGAALGVLIAVGSTKQHSPLLDLRLASLQRYETLIPELELLTGLQIPYNRQGIVNLCFEPTAWRKWQRIAQTRQQQGLTLELLNPDQLEHHYPTLCYAANGAAHSQDTSLQGAVYAPQDRQVDPIALTQALITASQQRGVEFHFQTDVIPIPAIPPAPITQLSVNSSQTGAEIWDIDALVIAAGTGSWRLTQALQAPVEIHPVLGQALHLRCEQPWCPVQSPVIQAGGVHLVPLAGSRHELWVGATVELPTQGVAPTPEPAQLDQIYHQAIALCPALANATILKKWVGWRPRPIARPAPIIERLARDVNVWLATGHYRNGVLLAPITGLKLKQAVATLL